MVPPEPRSIMRRPAAWDMRKVPRTLTLSTWSKRSRGISAGGAPHVAPLLLTTTSRLPNASSAATTTLSTLLGVGDVALDGERPAALGLYLPLHFFEGFYLARAQHDGGPGVGEGLGHVAAEAASAARY